MAGTTVRNAASAMTGTTVRIGASAMAGTTVRNAANAMAGTTVRIGASAMIGRRGRTAAADMSAMTEAQGAIGARTIGKTRRSGKTAREEANVRNVTAATAAAGTITVTGVRTKTVASAESAMTKSGNRVNGSY